MSNNRVNHHKCGTIGQMKRWSSVRGKAKHGNHQQGSCYEEIRRDRLGRKDIRLKHERKAIRNTYAPTGKGCERRANTLCINYNGTTSLVRKEGHSLENLMAKGYLTRGSGSASPTSVLSLASIINQPVSERTFRKWFNRNSMDARSCRCAAANQDLRNAQNMYVTRASKRSKRKIAELEAKVKQEEASK